MPSCHFLVSEEDHRGSGRTNARDLVQASRHAGFVPSLMSSKQSKSGASSAVTKKGKAGSAVEKDKVEEAGSKKQVLVCQVCKKRPGAVSWAEVINNKPVGQKCLPCSKVWSTHFGFLSWEDHVKLMQSEVPGYI